MDGWVIPIPIYGLPIFLSIPISKLNSYSNFHGISMGIGNPISTAISNSKPHIPIITTPHHIENWLSTVIKVHN